MRPVLPIVCLVAVLFMPGPEVRAETGMGLVVDKTNMVLHRIDYRNDAIIYTSPPIGTNVKSTRFSPDGDWLVYLDEDGEVFVCDLDGNVQQSFQAFSTGSVSWTDSGIWVGGEGRAELYDAANGSFIQAITPTGAPDPFKIKFRVMAHSETSYSALDHPPPIAKAVLVDQGNLVFDLGSGCSVGPSPDGNFFTHNLWEDGLEHQTMYIQDRTGAVIHYFYLFDIIPYPSNETDGWTWNSQSWSSNSQDIILIPAGRGYPQMDYSTVPWIYNLATGEAHCLYGDPYVSDVFWYIVDYYHGKVGVVIPEVTIESFVTTPAAIRNGESATLSWRVINSTEVRLDGQVVAAEDSQSVSPDATTNYTLEAEGEGGPKTQQATLTVTNNLPPEVDAGPDIEVGVDVARAVNASVSDDGVPGGGLAIQWTQESGPGTVAFSQPTEEDTSITCPAAGEYVLRLTASDGELEGFDELAVTVVEEQEYSIQILSPMAGDEWLVGETRAVTWTTQGIRDVVIYYSIDDGAGWKPLAPSIDDTNPDWGSIDWEIPDEPSTECWVRMESYEGLSPTQSGPFTIAHPVEEEEIVVKGGCGCRTQGEGRPAILVLLVSMMAFGMATRRS